MASAISLGIGGIAGWRILQRIESRQIEATAKDPVVQRAATYFRDNLTNKTTAEDLVGNYKMLQVALGAFGLGDDIGNKAFIRKVLESDIGDKASLVNRLSDKRYLKLAQQFQERGEDSVATGQAVTQAYVQQQFQKRVGEGDESFRLAMNARNELRGFASRSSSDKTLWYEVLGNEPLRMVFQGAFGFGKSTANLPIDRQLDEFMKASNRVLGSSRFTQLSKEESIDKLVTRYLALSSLQSDFSSNRYNAALTLLTR